MSVSWTIVLASTSHYRRALLERLRLPFECADPALAEDEEEGEDPSETALRLAAEKARAVAGRFPDALIIGSDQVASLDGEVLGKPGNYANASAQLRKLSGRTAQFDTAVALFDSRTRSERARLVPCRVSFRRLTDRAIETYLQREQPYDCAGSAKAEALGIALISSIDTSDPTALIGLPLIALTEMLEEAGMPVLG